MSRTVTVEDAPDGVERRSIVVEASPSAVFDLLADPSRHHEFDGSGTVRSGRDGNADRLSPGARFGMSMKWFVPYPITNEVVEFVEDELLAWRHLGRHVWRYRLEPTADSTDDRPRTRVVEEFDLRPAVSGLALRVIGAPARNAEAIEATLRRLADVVES